MNQMHPPHYTSLYAALVVSITLPCFLCSSPVDYHYVNCSQPFDCGNTGVVGDLGYPFWGINRASYCGKSGFELKCIDNAPVINISTVDLQIIGSNPQAHKITVVFKEFLNNLCPSAVFNKLINDSSAYSSVLASINSGSLFTSSSTRFLTILYGCPSELGNQLGWSTADSCIINNTNIDVHYVTHPVDISHTRRCKSAFLLPIPDNKAEALDGSTITLREALDEGFEMNWLLGGYTCEQFCTKSGGQCGYNWTIPQFTCYCPDNSYSLECQRSQPGHPKKTISIVAFLGTATEIVVIGFLVYFSKHILQKCKPIPKDQRVEDCLKNYKSSFPRRYTYASVKQMTNSFKWKLGEGGYGAVFKGSLFDGHAIAVKVWKQSDGDGQEFINEVMSISRTSHVNIVPLLGFCFEGHKRALIYEFMPNGSLEKFICIKDSIDDNQSLPTLKLLDIVVGIARGLEYLHRGCNTGIVHFDIKPHNILLDVEFTPKISDFGLAKSFKQKESIISMSRARGTAGYIAPEWIYKQLEQGTTFDSDGILSEDDKGLERKMILVGLWCIQTNPMSRPPISRVVEMLEGKVELLQVPPMPCLISPPRQQLPNKGSDTCHSSTKSTNH